LRNKILLQKTVELCLTLLLSSFLLFFLIHLAPGDPVKLLLGDPEVAMTDTGLYQKRYAEMREELHLDANLMVQYGIWLQRILKLDLGNSIFTKRPVSEELLTRLPATLLLSLPALALQVSLGILLGTASAVRRGETTDQAIRMVCVILASLPAFALGLLLLYYFGVVHHVYEISNTASWSRLWLPTLTLGIISSPPLIRLMRANMLQEFGKTYISFTIARGMGRSEVIYNAFRNTLLPLITMTALSLTSLLGGSVIVENVFSWPGVGKYALDSILLHDYPVIQGYGFVMLILVIVVNYLVDVACIYADPRLRRKEVAFA